MILCIRQADSKTMPMGITNIASFVYSIPRDTTFKCHSQDIL